jgi:thymidine phosphorylase
LTSTFRKKLARDHTARTVVELKADRSGFVTQCNARLIGEVIRDLGAGRLTKESAINYDVGVDRLAKPGELVKAGNVLARIHAASRTESKVACERLGLAFTVSPRGRAPAELVAGVVLP